VTTLAPVSPPLLGRVPGAPLAPPWLLPTGPTVIEHLRTLGPLPAHGPEVIGLIETSGLRGRGGAAFRTARKLAAVGSRPGRRVVIANGTEGEPLSGKDTALILHAPHLVLDGLAVAVAAVQAELSVICVEARRRDLMAALRAAAADRRDPVPVEILETPARYVSGQESALAQWVGGGPARPTGRRPDISGVGGRPTLVDNVETLANLALIARFGPAWYRRVGKHDDPGTRLVSVSGQVRRGGVYEIATGYSLADLLVRSGAESPRAVLLGGYSGRWIRPDSTTTLDSTNLGAGIVVAIGNDTCALHEVARVAEWFAANSARQCGACEFGLADIAGGVGRLDEGRNQDQVVADLRRWTAMVRKRGACHLPDGAADFVSSALDVFRAEIDEHGTGTCARARRSFLPTPSPEPWR
jgi:NADH:ubiquinone oxidoreductase subunit F (NADH-binding)